MGRQRRIGTTRAPLLGVTRAITPFNQPRNIVSDKLAPAIATTAGYRRVILEPGGNDPLIVMEDADLARAADLAVAGATRNSGQRRTAVKRILVVASVADEVAPRSFTRGAAPGRCRPPPRGGLANDAACAMVCRPILG